MQTQKIGIALFTCLLFTTLGCNDDLDVSAFVSNGKAVCAHHEGCDAAYDEQTCLDDLTTEANRLKKSDGDDCQEFVDQFAAYYGCMANTLTCDATSVGDCEALSVALGELTIRSDFDCPRAVE